MLANSDSTTKTCRICRQTFPATTEYFPKEKNGKDGVRNNCKQCERERVRKINYERYHSDSKYREKVSDAQRKRRLDPVTRSKIDEERKRYYSQPENIQKKIDYRHNNPDVHKAARHRQRARAKSLPSQFTRHEWRHCLNYFSGMCAYCGQPQGLWNPIAVDHWIPLKDDNCPGTIPENIVPACKSCNKSKGSSHPYEWLIEQFGTRKANAIIHRIEEYFASWG